VATCTDAFAARCRMIDHVADGVAGTWSVDSETGEFDFESATGTFARIRIDEELASIGTTQAVGRTGDVTGTVVIDGTSVTSADIEVDLTTITTNDTVVLVGSAEIAFSDYDVEVPSAPIVLSVSDTGTLELQLLLSRG